MLQRAAGDGRWLRPRRQWLGLALALRLVGLWFAVIAWKSGGAFYAEVVGHDMLGKVGGVAERHW